MIADTGKLNGYIDGETPAHFVGKECEELQFLEFWNKGTRIESPNVAYLKFGGEWRRLYFDGPFIFWRRAESGPVAYEAPEVHSSFPVFDVASTHGLRGRSLQGISMGLEPGGAKVVLAFSGGIELAIVSENDLTSYALLPSMPR